MRGILPIIAGAVLGALVVAMLPGGRNSVLRATVTDAVAPGSAAAPAGIGGAQIEVTGRIDAGISLNDLSAIDDPIARRRAALDQLAMLGHDAAGIDRIAAALSPTEAVNFRIDAIAQLAASDSAAAFAAIVALPDREQRRLALLRLAPVLAGIDPVAAMAAVEVIGSPDLKTGFVAALLDAWAVVDPARVFDFLESANAAAFRAAEATLEALAESDPERLLAIAETLPSDVAGLATATALEVLIAREPESALSQLAALPPGAERTRLEFMAAQRYGEQDPAAAWSWVADSGMGADSRIAVIRGIHQVDPDMAWEIMLAELNSPDDRLRGGAREGLMNYVYAVANSAATDDIVTGLDRLLGLNEPYVDSQMETNLWAWASRDPEAALDWSLRNLDRFDESRLLANLSAGLARANVDLARDTIYRLDETQRVSWAAGVGRALAESDLVAARSWAYELPRGPLRDAGLLELMAGEARGGTVDRQLFAQFSNDRSRDEAARSAALRIACDGRSALALEIARTYIADAGLLDSTVGQIDGSRGSLSLNPLSCGILR